MILIFSEYEDTVTDNIIVYLRACGEEEIVRINYPERHILRKIQIDSTFSSIQFTHRGELLDLNKVTKVFFRRGKLKFAPCLDKIEHSQLLNSIHSFLYKEEDILIRYIEEYLSLKTTYIGSYGQEVDNNKLSQISNAVASSLLIPDTLITSDKTELIDFIKKNTNVITKDLRYLPNFNYKGKKYVGRGTQLIGLNDISELPETFSPMLFQKMIVKRYEIRIFFINLELYCMCIFSQSNEKTQVDFRHEVESAPTRTIPYLLPKEINENVLNFIKISGLTTGSIDLIYSTDNKYYFLEVNPCGQFHWLSHNCNFDIEKDIANTLIS